MALLNQTQQDYYDGSDFGGYQFTSLSDIINQFMVVYVGENKIIPKVRRTDVAFHAQRAMQELSFDTFKSIKSQEITLPPSLTMMLPQDYVNYTKVCWTDDAGIEHPLYPTKNTSNPTPILQNSDGEYHIETTGTLTANSDEMVLNTQVDTILIGMVISGDAGGVEGNIVTGVQVTSGITTVKMDNDSTQTTTSGQSFEFRNADGSIVLESESQFTIEGMTAPPGSPFFSAASITDVVNVREGMIVSAFGLPIGTTVTSVNLVDGRVYVNNTPPSGTTDVLFTSPINNSTEWTNYMGHDGTVNNQVNYYNYNDEIYDLNLGQRYGLEPSHAQVNGSYYIDNIKGLIHFSSNVAGKNVVLRYISDGLGTDEEMQVHKFAEEAMYKSIALGVLSASTFGQGLVPRFKKERFAAVRQAKLRLSNLKIEELTQIMRGKSKWIKH